MVKAAVDEFPEVAALVAGEVQKRLVEVRMNRYSYKAVLSLLDGMSPSIALQCISSAVAGAKSMSPLPSRCGQDVHHWLTLLAHHICVVCCCHLQSDLQAVQYYDLKQSQQAVQHYQRSASWLA